MNDQPPEILIPAELARLLDSDWREAAVYGGRNSLKSHTVARVLLIRAMNSKIRVGCFREFQNSIADSSHALLKGLIEKYKLNMFKVTNDGILNTVNGSDFIFKGLHNNIQSVKSIEGMNIAWVEEAQTITESSLDVLTPTVREEGSQIIYTYNRLMELDPVHNRIVVEGMPNSLILNVNYDVALKYGWMSSAIENEMEHDKLVKPDVYKHKWLGEPSNQKGRIFKDWKKIESVPKEAKYMGPGLDFGYTNDPTAIIDVYKWNNIYILDEIVYEQGLSNRKIANRLRLNAGLDPVSEMDNSFVGDTKHLTVGDSSEPKSIDEISRYGVTIIGATKGQGSVDQGIQLLQDREIHYTARSIHIEEETLNYKWKLDPNGKSLNVPVDAYNHAMDAARYKITDIEGTVEVQWGGVR